MRLAQLCVSLLVIGLIGFIDCYKVLLLFPFPGKSHSILGEGYVNILLRDGHEVTYVTPFVIKNAPKNLTQFDVSSLMNILPPEFKLVNVMDKTIAMTDHNVVIGMMQSVTKEILLHDNVQALLNDRSKHFDVVIAEWLFSELYAGFANVFSCPLIWSSPTDPHWEILELLSHHTSPAVVPQSLAPTQPPYSLLERINALCTMIHIKFLKFRKFTPMDREIYKEAYSTAAAARGVELRTFDEMRLNASLMLGNSHIATGQAMTLPASYIPIGGYHILGENEKMTPELQEIMDSSTQGVIYFSMGSMIKSKDMPEEMKRGLIEVFSKFKQTVLWKMEESIPNLPKNIHTVQWAPQRSILKHPNTVLFISHGGLLSTTEALYYGVPLIGIPAFADQFQNIARAVQKGFAVEVTLTRELAPDLEVAIRKVLDNDKYKESVRFLSWVFKSGGNSSEAITRALRLAVEGGTMLRPPTLPLYQVLYLDVAGFTLVGLLVMVWGLRMLLRRLTISRGKQKAL